MIPVDVEFGYPSVQTSSATIKTGAGVLIGFFCNSTSSGTIVLRDGTGDSDTAVSGTITPSAGTFYRFPAFFTNGIRATIANTISVTFFYR